MLNYVTRSVYEHKGARSAWALLYVPKSILRFIMESNQSYSRDMLTMLKE